MTQKKEKRTFFGWLKWAGNRYFIRAMSSMALGLFSSLIIGLILSQLSKLPFLSWLAPFAEVVSASSPVVGSAIGVAVAHGLGAKPLVMFSSAVTGAVGYNLGGPVGAFLASVVGAELGGLVAGRTPVDIVLVPVDRHVRRPRRIGADDGPGRFHQPRDAAGSRADGHCGVHGDGALPDRTHLQCGHCDFAGAGWACRRCGGGRVLGADDRLCRRFLSGE